MLHGINILSNLVLLWINSLESYHKFRYENICIYVTKNHLWCAENSNNWQLTVCYYLCVSVVYILRETLSAELFDSQRDMPACMNVFVRTQILIQHSYTTLLYNIRAHMCVCVGTYGSHVTGELCIKIPGRHLKTCGRSPSSHGRRPTF